MEPNNKPAAAYTAKNFFLQVGVMVALYTSVVSFLSFMFGVINYAFPDRQAYYGDPYGTSIRFAISTLIIAFPIMVYLFRLLKRSMSAEPALRDGALRRWLSYLTLFVAGIVLAGDLIYILNTFLAGEITSRFAYKALLVLAVVGAVFWFVLRDLRGVYFQKPQLLKLFTIIVSAVILGCVVWGFTIIGSPMDQRKLRDDNARVNHLQTLQGNITNRYQMTGKLPESLDELVDNLNPYMEEYMNDPKTGESYEYRTIASTTPSFELCATFELDTKDMKGRGEYPGGRGGGIAYDMAVYPPYPYYGDNTFEHTAGRNCFTRSIDPEIYPIYPKPGATTEPARF